MPDQSDVEAALVGLIGDAILPAAGGAYQPGAFLPGPNGVQAKVARGWPDSTRLEADLAAGRVTVNVFPDAAMQRNDSRYLAPWTAFTATAPTLTASVAGSVVTFGGATSASQAVSVLIGPLASATAYAYRCAATDTPASVALAFAAMIAGATAAGPFLTLPAGPLVRVRVGMDQTASREVRRVQQVFRVYVYAPDPLTRDTATSAVDAAVAAVTFLDVAGYAARIRWHGTATDDKPGKAAVWLRTLAYMVEYATDVTIVAPEMLAGVETSGPAAPVYG